MKKTALFFIIYIISLAAVGQDITGQWNGILKTSGVQLRIVIHIAKSGNEYLSTMDSPDQGAKAVPVAVTSFIDSTLKFAIPGARIEYQGLLGSDNVIVGTFKQGGMPVPLNFSRAAVEKETNVRPQEPIKPYPYYSEDIVFENKQDGIALAGTLTLPKKEGVFPAVILISGSGPQDRNEELMGHKPFLVLADYLTSNGIAVLRFDDRGTALSKGDFKSATTMDFSTDVAAGVDYLQTRKEINKKKIGLIGHSEGGVIAPIVASKRKDISFIVLLAGTGISGDKLLLLQQQLIGRAAGLSETELQNKTEVSKSVFEILKKSTSTGQFKTDLTNFLTNAPNNTPPKGIAATDFIQFQVNQYSSPWMQYFIKYDPATALEQVKCPVLAINGEKDLQVPPRENLEAIKEALLKGGNKKVTTIQLANLNHLFQEAETGSPSEYAKIEQTFSPVALKEVLTWIQTQVR